MRYYATQYGYFWSLSQDEAKDLLGQIAEDIEYDLDNYKLLKQKPSDKATGYGARIINPLGLDPETATWKLEQINK